MRVTGRILMALPKTTKNHRIKDAKTVEGRPLFTLFSHSSVGLLEVSESTLSFFSQVLAHILSFRPKHFGPPHRKELFLVFFNPLGFFPVGFYEMVQDFVEGNG